jgi:two-component system, LuxR family, response regulator FixJ
MPDKTVFVVDDDAAVRQGLRFMLRAAGCGVEAFPSAAAFLEEYNPRRGGCLLLDVRMPQMTGLELQQQLNVRGWRIPVIFITGHGTISLAIAAMKAGAFDFIEKPLREDALLESIERALHWNDRAYEERLERATLEVRVALLTPREREVFELVAAGEPNKVIARHLGISFRTVELPSRTDHREIASTQPVGLDPDGDNHELQSASYLSTGEKILRLPSDAGSVE